MSNLQNTIYAETIWENLKEALSNDHEFEWALIKYLLPLEELYDYINYGSLGSFEKRLEEVANDLEEEFSESGAPNVNEIIDMVEQFYGLNVYEEA